MAAVVQTLEAISGRLPYFIDSDQ